MKYDYVSSFLEETPSEIPGRNCMGGKAWMKENATAAAQDSLKRSNTL